MKSRERKLMWVFGAALLVCGCLFLGTMGTGWVSDLLSENQRLRDRVDEMNQLVASRSSWQQRDDWLDEATPHFASRQEASAALLEAVEKLDGKGISLLSRQLTEPAGADGNAASADGSSNDYFEATSVKLELKAPEAVLYRWLHLLHQPDSFRGVTSLTIGRAETDGSLRAELELTQYFLP